MMRSASGTYSLPSACMKSYWVSTSQKMTRAIVTPRLARLGNLRGSRERCQRASQARDGVARHAVFEGSGKALPYAETLDRLALAHGGRHGAGKIEQRQGLQTARALLAEPVQRLQAVEHPAVRDRPHRFPPDGDTQRPIARPGFELRAAPLRSRHHHQ